MFAAFAASEFKIPPDWVYRGEGNCNVVISLPHDRKILRIRKIKKTTSLFSWLLNWITDFFKWYRGNGLDEELRDITFYKNVMRPLVGSNFVSDAEQVFLSRKQVKILEEELAHQRPNHRKSKCLQYGRAALFDDAAFLPDQFYPFLLSSGTYSVEIKPKQGWVPFSERHYPKCTFCMNQYLKIETGQAKSLSSYCPADLFSGESSKMINALKALLENPQNNLKIFKNGQLYYSEENGIESFQGLLTEIFNNEASFEKLTLEFCSFIKTCLLRNFGAMQRLDKCSTKLFCEWNNIIQESSNQCKLPRGSVLERILSVQMLDVEGNQYYYKLLGNRACAEYDYVEELLKEVEQRSDSCLKCIIMTLGNVGNFSRKDWNSMVLVPYLISAIARDCSLMLTFKRIMEVPSDQFETENVVRTNYGDFIVNVGVFDLYPKPVSTILNHRKKIKRMLDFMAN